VVQYSSDVLCTHKTRLQLMYTDVQQLKMVQMVSQSQFFRNFYLPSLMRLPICLKNVRNFKQNFAQLGRQPLKIFYNAVTLLSVVDIEKKLA